MFHTPFFQTATISLLMPVRSHRHCCKRTTRAEDIHIDKLCLHACKNSRIPGVANTFQNLRTANEVSWERQTDRQRCLQPNMTLNTLTTTSALLLVSSILGPSIAINNSHLVLVRSRTIAGIPRFLAGLFTFLSRRAIVNRLRGSDRKCFRTIITTVIIKNIFKSDISALTFAL